MDLSAPYYAKTKCIGEEAIRLHLKNHLIIRTSWLYGHHSQNFVHKIAHKLAKFRKLLPKYHNYEEKLFHGDFTKVGREH